MDYILKTSGKKVVTNFFPFSHYVDMAIKGQPFSKKNLLVCNYTPKTLVDAGLNNRPMYISSKHVISAVKPFDDEAHNHGIERDDLVKLPEYLNDPAIIFLSGNKDEYDAFTVITDRTDKLNQPVMCCIHADGKVDGKLVNYITSVYGKRPYGAQSLIKRALNDNSVMYINEDKCKKIANLPANYKITSYSEIKQKKYMNKDLSWGNI